MLERFRISAEHSSAVRDSVWLTGEKLLNMALVLVVNVFLARYLGPSGYGELAFLLAVVALTAPLSSLGMNGILVRELVNTPEEESRILATSLAFRTLAGIVSLALLLLFFSAFRHADSRTLLWIALFGASIVLNGLLSSQFWFQAKVRSRVLARVRLAAVSLFGLMKIAAVSADLGTGAIYAIFALELSVLPVVGYLCYRQATEAPRRWSPDWRYGVDLLRSSSWLILSGIASVIYLKIDLLMLAEMTTLAETGLYAVASRLSEVWYFVPTAIVAAFFPILLKHRRTSDLAYRAHLERFYSLLFWMATSIAACVSLIASPVIELLYGDDFTGAATILTIHVWAGVFIFMRALFSKWLIAENILHFSLVTHGLGAVVNVALNLVLIPHYQAVGAAWATVISYATASFLALLCNRRTFGSAMMMMRAPFYPLRPLLRRTTGPSLLP